MRRRIQVLTGVIAGVALLAGVAVAATSPSVVTGGRSSVTQSSAVLHGTVNPNGSSTAYFFQWGLTTGYGVNGRTHSAGGGNTAVSVKETAGGLTPGTTYHYRLVATNQGGTSVGRDRTFRTAGHPPPGVSTGPATNLSTTGADLTGTVNPSGASTTWFFEWGNSTTYTEQTTHQVLASNAAPQSVAASLQGLLAPGTIYHYRLVASHPGSATSFGSDATFMTYPSPRPVPHVTAQTRPLRATHRPFALTTSGRISDPASIPAQYACHGNVTIRFFRGIRQVKFNLAPVQPNCTFAARSVFSFVRRPPAHLRVVIRYVSTPYLATNRARYEHITVG